MSFRSRLLLFFTIIVVIPMIAVALVLFSLTADSETGKADAEIAQGMRAAFSIYDADRDRAHRALDAVARDAKLGAALAHPQNHGALAHRLLALQHSHGSIASIAVYDLRHHLIASSEPLRSDAIAVAVASPSTAH